jgi:hypothetical protein
MVQIHIADLPTLLASLMPFLGQLAKVGAGWACHACVAAGEAITARWCHERWIPPGYAHPLCTADLEGDKMVTFASGGR